MQRKSELEHEHTEELFLEKLPGDCTPEKSFHSTNKQIIWWLELSTKDQTILPVKNMKDIKFSFSFWTTPGDDSNKRKYYFFLSLSQQVRFSPFGED